MAKLSPKYCVSIATILSSMIIPVALGPNQAQAFDTTTYVGVGGSAGGNGPAFNAFNAFQTFLGNPYVEDFEGFSLNSTNPVVNFGGGLTATISAPTANIANATLPGINGSVSTVPTAVFPNQTDQFLFSIISPDVTQSFNIVFNQSIKDFGFFITDLGDFGAQASMQLKSGGVNGTIVDTLALPTNPTAQNGQIFFQGVAGQLGDPAFDTITIFVSNASNADGFGLDGLIANALTITPPPVQGTPEPGTLVGLALLGTAGFVSRRKNK